MSTKANFDTQTLPWIISNALPNLQAKQNIMIMNDFIDGATTYTAYQLSRSRFAQQTEVTGFDIEAPTLTLEPSGLTTEQAEALKATEEATLEDEKANQALLQAITAANQSVLADKADVSEEDKRVQAVLAAIQAEAEDATRKQQEVVDLATKSLQSLAPN